MGGTQLDSTNPLHFTYARPEGEDLQQGDIIGLRKLENAGLDGDLSGLPSSTYSLVILTQTCDMVSGRVKTNHIALAPAVPLSEIINERIAELQKLEVSKLAGVCGNNQKGKLIEFLRKLFNNNEPHYFYLHEEHQFGLEEPMCAFLRRPIVLSLVSNYSILANARDLSLTEEFRAKLGWLVGSIYSRVATQDWPRDKIDGIIETVLTDACGWEDHARLEAAETARKAGQKIPDDKVAMAEYIRAIVIPTKQEQILTRVREVLNRMEESGRIGEEVTEEVCRRLASDAAFRRHTAQ